MYRPATDPRVAPRPGVTSASVPWRVVGPNVWFLGLTSLVTDISSEMVVSILPAYTVLMLGVSPAIFGVLDGLQQGGASLARIVSGVATDRLGRYKELAAIGYVASALSRLGMLVAGASPVALAGAVLTDRIGKGVRTSPRDALISMSVPPAVLGAAFGVHRTLDTVGATLGPIIAFTILRFTGGDYPSVLVASLAVALIGVAILVTYVRNPNPERAGALAPLQSRQALRAVLSDRRLKMLVVCAAALGLVTAADSMIYLVLQRRVGLASGYLPLLFVATPAVYALLATPFGWLGDRLGPGTILAAGYGGLAVLYTLLLLPPFGWLTLAGCVVLLGAHYAATDGLLAAVASASAPPAIRATAIAFVGTALDTGRLVASIAFGAVWSFSSPDRAVGVFLVGLLLVLVAVSPRLARIGRTMADT